MSERDTNDRRGDEPAENAIAIIDKILKLHVQETGQGILKFSRTCQKDGF